MKSLSLNKMFAFLFFLLVLFFPKLAAVAISDVSDLSGLRIYIPNEIRGYQSNPLTIEAPEDGKLSLEIKDETTLYRVLESRVSSGKSQVIWDGLGWNEERLARKHYTLTGTLEADSGALYTTSVSIRVGHSSQAVLFALPSDPDLYLETPQDWFLEFKLLFTDQLTVAFTDTANGRKTLEISRTAKGGKVNQISWKKLIGKETISPGSYRVRVFGSQHPAAEKEFDLTIHEGKRPELSLQVTGNIMPERGDSDETVWTLMMKPAVVVDIRNVAHQRVYSDPDSSSSVLGTLHGQSQSLSVLEIQEKWVKISAWNHERGAFMEGWVPRKVLKVVQPQQRYGLLVDKKAQTLTLYQDGQVVDTLLVSTGRMKKGELYQETAAGSFLTDLHMSDYSTNGLKYDFVIRYDGGNLLHQIPYAWDENGKKDLLPGEMYLGSKASHACIRIQEKPSEKGINAYWFWTHLPYHTRVIVLDDPEEREGLERILTGKTPKIEDGLAESAWKVDTGEENEKKIVITFGGDTVLGARESYYGNSEGLPAYLDQKGEEWPFEKLRDLFYGDDLTVVNLECALKDTNEGEDMNKAWRFRGMTNYAGCLKTAGIEIVNIANNHTFDYGEEGYRSTIMALEGIVQWCGNGYNTIVEIEGCRFGFGGCRETNFIADPGIIDDDIRTLTEQNADFIIYQCHWGTEYDGYHNGLQEAMARACKRAGADLVIGHHPHVVQGIEWIDDMPVVYSLGNLMFGGTIRLTTYDALLVQASFYPLREENRISLKLIPVLTSSEADAKINNYQPVIAERDDALRIFQKIQQDTPWLLTDRVRMHY